MKEPVFHVSLLNHDDELVFSTTVSEAGALRMLATFNVASGEYLQALPPLGAGKTFTKVTGVARIKIRGLS